MSGARTEDCGAVGRKLGRMVLAIALVSISGSRPVLAQPADGTRSKPILAIENVTILPMNGTATLPNSTVLIAGDRIVAIGNADDVLPKHAMRLDGTGKWLMPTLTDMHVHFVAEPIPELPYSAEEVLSPFVANGVLQVVDLASSEHTNTLRDRVARGDLRAPRIASARMVDGDPPIWGPETAMVLNTPNEAHRGVSNIVAEGYNFIKVYSRLDIKVFRALLKEAQVQNIRVIGHIPGRGQVDVTDALLPGFAMVAHAEEFAFRAPHGSDEEIAEYVALARETGLALTSTLYLNEQLAAQTRDPRILAEVEGLAQVNPVELPGWFETNRYTAATSPERVAQLEAVVDFNRRLVKAFVEAGIPVFAGTDTGVSGVAPGYSLHEELQALTRAGLTNAQILATATSGPARWLGVASDRGTVEVGQRANLLLLDADPLADISNTRAIAAVIVDGQVIEREELDAMMSELAALYAPLRGYFSPRAAEVLTAD